jgi:hypothetical protein
LLLICGSCVETTGSFRGVFPHNEFMRFRETLYAAVLSLIVCALLMVSPSAAKTPASASDSGYVSALAAADRLLQAWQSGDLESGVALLTTHAKEAATSDNVEKFFSSSDPSAYEIGRGTLLRRGRYEFPVVLARGVSKKIRGRRRFSSIIVVNTGNNEWAVDKLPLGAN